VALFGSEVQKASIAGFGEWLTIALWKNQVLSPYHHPHIFAFNPTLSHGNATHIAELGSSKPLRNLRRFHQMNQPKVILGD